VGSSQAEYRQRLCVRRALILSFWFLCAISPLKQASAAGSADAETVWRAVYDFCLTRYAYDGRVYNGAPFHYVEEACGCMAERTVTPLTPATLEWIADDLRTKPAWLRGAFLAGFFQPEPDLGPSCPSYIKLKEYK
jgi:hypothetical protein